MTMAAILEMSDISHFTFNILGSRHRVAMQPRTQQGSAPPRKNGARSRLVIGERHGRLSGWVPPTRLRKSCNAPSKKNSDRLSLILNLVQDAPSAVFWPVLAECW